MLQFQSYSRNREAKDVALLIDNNSYVQNWSLAQICIILITCTVQVNRKFFKSIRKYWLILNVIDTYLNIFVN